MFTKSSKSGSADGPLFIPVSKSGSADGPSSIPASFLARLRRVSLFLERDLETLDPEP